MSSEYHETPPIRVLFLNLYQHEFIKYSINPIPIERIDELLKSGTLFADAKAFAVEGAREQASYAWDFCDCLTRAVEESLSILQIPNHSNHLSILGEVKHCVFSKEDFRKLIESFVEEFDIVVIAGNSEILDQITSMSVIPMRLDAKILQNESLNLFIALWQKVGEFCLRLGYVTEEQHLKIFSVEMIETTVRMNGLRYLSRNGEHFSEPQSGAFIIVPKFQPALVEIVD